MARKFKSSTPRTQMTRRSVRKALLTLGLTLLLLMTATGCNEMYYYAAMGAYSMPYWTGYVDVGAIQSVNSYRQDAMDWTADAWDEYILE